MCRLYTLIFIGCICFAAYGQSPEFNSLDSIRQTLTAEDGSEEPSLSDRMEEMLGPSEPSESPVEVSVPVIEVPLIPETTEIPAVNQGTAEVLDTRGRYSPRLRIDFTDFPLRSLNKPNQQHETSPADAIVRQIRKRFRLPDFQLTIVNRHAIISGTAAPHQRNMIATMLRFVPGIDTVQNDLSLEVQR